MAGLPTHDVDLEVAVLGTVFAHGDALPTIKDWVVSTGGEGALRESGIEDSIKYGSVLAMTSWASWESE